MASIPSFTKSRPEQFAMIVIPTLTVLFLIVLVVQQYQLERSRDEGATLRAQMHELQVQNAFYKKAYEITLDDIRQLSTAYGGNDPRYDALADRLRSDELGEVLGDVNGTERYTLKNERLWHEYSVQGIVNASCLARPAKVDTISDEILLTVRAHAQNSSASLYMDGNALGGMQIAGEAQRRVMLRLSPGEHELDILSPVGSVTVDEVLFDTVRLPVENATADLGRAWAVFDCANAQPGASLSAPGAVRLLLSKQ
jgi:hypothetical protein